MLPAPHLRPAILQATKLVGLNDSEVARSLNVSAMTVSRWARAKDPMPPARHAALFMVMLHLLGQEFRIGDNPPAGIFAKRAQLLREVVWRLLIFEIEELERNPLTSEQIDAADEMAEQMVKKIELLYEADAA
jgi:hypothetical protein